MALQQEIWIKDIQEQLYAGNDWLKRSVDDSEFIAYKTVHVPQAGASALVTKDRSSLPATIIKRTDTELTYDLAEYSLDPFVVTALETLQMSYDKRMSIMQDNINKLQDVIALHAMYNWAPSGVTASAIVMTGATSTNALVGSATGSRTTLTLADIARAKNKLDLDKVPSSGRVMLVPSAVYNNDILNNAGIIQYLQYGTPVLPDGVVSRIHGFDIYERPDVLVYALDKITPKAISGDGSVTTPLFSDNYACLCYHPRFVSTATGTINVFLNEKKAEYFGDLISALVQHGSSKRRADGKGVCAIVQSA